MSSVLQADPVKLPDGITEHDIEQYAKLDLAIKKLQPKHRVLNDKIKKAFVMPGTWIVKNVVIKRTAANSFDAVAAAKKYPQSRYPQFYKSVLDTDAIPADVRAKFESKVQRLSVEVVVPIEQDDEVI